MKRGFLKNGLDGKPGQKVQSVAPKAEPNVGAISQAQQASKMQTAPPSSVRSPPSAKHGVGHIRSIKDELPTRPGPDIADPSHPLYHQGIAMDLSPSDGRSFVGIFGGGYEERFWDTVIIGEEKHHEVISAHPGYYASLTAKLATLNASYVKVAEVPGGKGLGLLATRDIPAGEVFVKERPLLFTTSSPPAELIAQLDDVLAKMMCPARRKAYYKLYNCKPKGPDMIESFSISRTNSIRVDFPEDGNDGYSAVFDVISRANHDCTPNALVAFNYETFCAELASIMPITAGSEVTISYISVLKPAKARKAKLQKTWKFHCACSACDSSSPSFAASDEAHKFLGKALDKAERQSQASSSKLEHLFTDAEIEQVMAALDSTRLFDYRFKFLALCALAEEFHAMKTRRRQKAARLAQRAMEQLTKGASEEATEKLKRSMQVIIANGAQAQKIVEGLTKDTHFQGLDADQVMNEMASIGEATALDPVQEAAFEKMSAASSEKFMKSSMADQRALIDGIQSLWKDAMRSDGKIDPARLDKARGLELFNKYMK